MTGEMAQLLLQRTQVWALAPASGALQTPVTPALMPSPALHGHPYLCVRTHTDMELKVIKRNLF